MRLQDYGQARMAVGTAYLGLFFVTVVALGAWGGDRLDQKFHTSPWLALIGLILGIVAGVREMMRALKTISPTNLAAPTRPAFSRRPGEDVKWTPPVLDPRKSETAAEDQDD